MKKKHKFDNIAMIIAIVVVLVFIIAECYAVTNVNLQTQTAVISSVNETIDTKAIIVRDEHAIANTSSGVVVPCFNDGDKIGVNGNVAMVFSASQQATQYSQKQQLEQELEYYRNLQSQSSGVVTNIESLNKEINENVDEYIRSVNSKDLSQVQLSADNLNDSLIRRQLLIGEQVDFSSTIADIEAQLNALGNCQPDSFVTTDVSGVFSSYTDGYENTVDYNGVGELTVEQVNDYTTQFATANQNQNNNIGKLVTSYSWYLVCVVNSDDLQDMENGDSIKITLKDNGDAMLNVQIVDGAEPDMGVEQTVLILKCNDMNAQLITQRCEDIQIICNTHTGIKVPVDAVHISQDKKGVYALISNQVAFREAEVIYTTDDYVLLSYDADNKAGIRLYDQIITQGKELEDGKVYT